MVMQESLKQITDDSIVLIDDVSYANRKVSDRKFAEVLSALTKIRHRKETAGRDVKVILLISYHYSRSIDKGIRSWTDWIWITGLKRPELSNYDDMFGARSGTTIYYQLRNFMKEQQVMLEADPESKEDRHWGPNDMYQHQEPFAAALVFNGSMLRKVAYPHPRLLGPCGICGAGGMAMRRPPPWC